ncbi:glycerophosphodiester phosphodiesterase [Halobacteriales archaeon QS_8_69_26]|nr:MAG: glycerophosphodiester phosphodiesterase [Halobacteriales archaeon QS_8_69_26]
MTRHSDASDPRESGPAGARGSVDTAREPPRTDGGRDRSPSGAVRPVDPVGEDDLPRLIAHRGFGGEYPENTLTAFRQAAERADVVEMDVRRCGSGELVVMHDETLERTTDGSGRVDETDLSTLRDLDVLGTGEGVPTLAEALDAVPPEVGVTVELKEDVVDDALPVLDVENEVVVSAFDESVLERVTDRGGPPTARTVLPGNRGAFEGAIELGCSAVHPERMNVFLFPDLVERAHRAGMAVNVWTVHERDDAARLAAEGVDGLTSDHPDVLEP